MRSILLPKQTCCNHHPSVSRSIKVFRNNQKSRKFKSKGKVMPTLGFVFCQIHRPTIQDHNIKCDYHDWRRSMPNFIKKNEGHLIKKKKPINLKKVKNKCCQMTNQPYFAKLFEPFQSFQKSQNLEEMTFTYQKMSVLNSKTIRSRKMKIQASQNGPKPN